MAWGLGGYGLGLTGLPNARLPLGALDRRRRRAPFVRLLSDEVLQARPVLLGFLLLLLHPRRVALVVLQVRLAFTAQAQRLEPDGRASLLGWEFPGTADLGFRV